MTDRSRPRLASHVRPRRHLVGAGSRVVLHFETAAGEPGALSLGEREWSVAASLDGTRDIEGIRLAAARAGVRVGAAHVEAFVSELTRLGLLEEREGAAEAAVIAQPRDLPLHPLPGWRFRCDGRGTCCRLFSTLVFSPREVAVARATLPDHRGAGDDPDRLFTPERGVERSLFAGALVGGECTYVEEDGRCALHAAGGPGAKPFGCRTFPYRFLDVGDAIRVAPRLECACALEPGGDPPLAVTRGRELDPMTFVPRLGEVALGGERVDAAALVELCDAVPAPSGDVAGFAAALADAIARDGARARVEAGAAAPAPLERVESIRARARRLLSRRAPLGLPEDRAARAARQIAARAPRADDPPTVGEALYLRALLFAPPEDEPLEDALRGAAARIRIARALPDAVRADPVTRYPLALVEALCRGYGLD